MNEEILSYIASQRICVLALEMMDGSPHAATVHFAHTDNPLMFFFETGKSYRKSEPLFGREITRASLVIGSDESTMKTLQINGEVRLIRASEYELYQKVYQGKFPQKNGKSQGPNYTRFVFTSTWWRFTDWTGPQGKRILTSTDLA